MSLKLAVDRIKGWAVTGVVTNYGADGLVTPPGDADLPALWLPLVSDRGGIGSFDLTATSANTVLMLDHVLLLKPGALGTPATHFYNSLAIIDNYVAKLKTDWTLNSNLIDPIQIMGVSFRPYVVGTMSYYSIVFKHQWRLVL